MIGVQWSDSEDRGPIQVNPDQARWIRAILDCVECSSVTFHPVYAKNHTRGRQTHEGHFPRVQVDPEDARRIIRYVQGASNKGTGDEQSEPAKQSYLTKVDDALCATASGALQRVDTVSHASSQHCICAVTSAG